MAATLAERRYDGPSEAPFLLLDVGEGRGAVR